MYGSTDEPLVYLAETPLSEFGLDYDLINRDLPLVDHGAGGYCHAVGQAVARVTLSDKVHRVGVAIFL